uniref:Glycosyltransferase family 92 protein n=1 Tax=Leptobrachium leishanense TaxID=445787 RepID=A0A8C5Q126_9ANUR
MLCSRKMGFGACLVMVTCSMVSMYYYRKPQKPHLVERDIDECPGKIARDVITALRGNETFIITPYHDPRDGSVTRVLGIVHHQKTKELFCYFCTGNQTIHVVKAKIEMHQDRFGFPFGLADIICEEPPNTRLDYIYLDSAEDADLTGLPRFRIQNKDPPRYTVNFTICISTMFGNYSNTLQLIQTMEMYKLLGAQKVTLYLNSCSPQVQEVLEYYVREGTLEVIPWLIEKYLKPSRRWDSVNDGTEIGYYGQLATLNDCIYRNMYKTKYVLVNDVDEIIMPRQHDNWECLIDSLQRQHKDVGVFRVENHIFPQTMVVDGNFSGTSSWREVPGFNLLQHVNREPDRPDYFNARKLIVDPRKVIQTSVHSVLKSQGKSVDVPLDVALILHCRGPLQKDLPKTRLIEDKRLWRYNVSLINNVNKVLDQIIFKTTKR